MYKTPRDARAQARSHPTCLTCELGLETQGNAGAPTPVSPDWHVHTDPSSSKHPSPRARNLYLALYNTALPLTLPRVTSRQVTAG